MRKVTIFVIGIGVALTFIVMSVVQVGQVTAKAPVIEQLSVFSNYVAANGAALSQGTLDDVVAALHSDPPTAGSSFFPSYYSSGFGYGLGFRPAGTGAYGTGAASQTLCAVNWLHNSGSFTWQGFVTVSQGDCETNQPVTRVVLSLDSSSTQTLNVGDLIEAFGAPIAAERPSIRSCVRVRFNVRATNGTTPPGVNAYNISPNFYMPSLNLYFENGFSATVPCYAGAQTTLNLESPVRAVTFTTPLPTAASAPFSYTMAQWHGLAAPSLYYAMCSATDDPRCQGRRLPRGGQNGFVFPPGAPPPSLFPTLVPLGP